MKPRYYQKEAVNAASAFLHNPSMENGLIALPTGAGKTLVIAELIHAYLMENPKSKVLVVSHVKEILEQNHAALTNYFYEGVGLYSSGLGSRQIKQVTVAGIQSIFRKAELFKKFSLIIVDEAHLFSSRSDSMYQKLCSQVNARMIGLTATPYRLDSGLLYGKDKVFHKCLIDYTSGSNLIKLVDEGYLSRPRTLSTTTTMDVSGIKKVAGELSEKQLADRFDVRDTNQKIAAEILSQKCLKGLIFAINIEHAEHLAELLGKDAVAISHKMKDRGMLIRQFKAGKYKYIVNVGILTTGFDEPRIDLIALARPTVSPGLFAQMVGRGFRIAENKSSFLVLDFAGNTVRLGPLTELGVEEVKERPKDSKPRAITCPKCMTLLPTAVKQCPHCKTIIREEVEKEDPLTAKASTLDLLSKPVNDKEKRVTILNIKYQKYIKGPRTSLKIVYFTTLGPVTEWIHIEASGYGRYKAVQWLKEVGLSPLIVSVDKVLTLVEDMRKPVSILVNTKGAYKEVIERDYIKATSRRNSRKESRRLSK